MKFDLPRGMRDLEPEEIRNINYIREKFLETISLFNFKFMEPSPIEMLSTLETKGGPTISNEIYSFSDKAGRRIALRFDLTIGLTRFVTARRDLKMPVKIATFGGVWRYDEPQAGRYRYFHQWDVEIYDSFSNESDAEVIEFVSVFFKKMRLDVNIEVNDRQLMEQFVRQRLGITEEHTILEMFRAVDKVPKKGARAVLLEYKDKIPCSLLERLIDVSKTTGTIDEVVQSQRDITDLVGASKLVKLMDSLKVRRVSNVRVNLGIVRGLDYYSGIVFEVFDSLDKMSALVGGGRYDNLTNAFGRDDMGASGAAGGVERLMAALEKHGVLKQNPSRMVYVAYATINLSKCVLEIVSILRNSGIITDFDLNGRALAKQLDDAYAKGAFLTVIVSPDDIRKGLVTLRSMKDGSESKQPIKDIAKNVITMLLPL
ncbi:MAG TPA: histidine--tRNA ligase [Nitrososphaeraceae archaeon]|nr:histidine--tRNA ligase [Nitrososphaeraceae archaeon]